MSTVTYDRAHVPADAATATATATAKRPGRWLRLYYRLIEAREKSVLAELRRHGLRLPQELEQAGWKINERSEDSLPFIR